MEQAMECLDLMLEDLSIQTDHIIIGGDTNGRISDYFEDSMAEEFDLLAQRIPLATGQGVERERREADSMYGESCLSSTQWKDGRGCSGTIHLSQSSWIKKNRNKYGGFGLDEPRVVFIYNGTANL
ncbi:hypothetical protein M8J77_007498 [Diaphorina citri]|nr:hypothetical protein M8J77_007498 [Diaphorina citri]